MMRSKFILPLVLATQFLLSGSAVGQDIVTLKIADNIPVKHHLAQYGTKYFMERVTELTDGQVKFQWYPSEQLGKARDMLSITQRQVADIGLVIASYVPDKMPLTSAMELPGDFESSCEGSRIYWELVKEGGFLDKHDLAPNGVRAIFVYVNPAYQLITRFPMTGLGDLEGKKIRTAGSPQRILVEKLGGVSVRTTAPELHQALSRGTVDGAAFPLPTIFSYDLQDLAKTVTKGGRYGSATTIYLMSRDRWEKLSPEHRKAIVQASEETNEQVCKGTDADVVRRYKELEARGVPLLVLNDQDQARFKMVAAEVEQAWIEEMESRGLPGKEARVAVSETIQKLSGK